MFKNYGTIYYRVAVKLQKHLAYTYKGKKTHKFVVVIPEKIIEELGWENGDALEAKKGRSNLLTIKKTVPDKPMEENSKKEKSKET